MWNRMKNDKRIFAFYAVAITATMFAIIWSLFYKGDPFRGFLWWDVSDTYMDFFNSVWDTKKFRPYDSGCIYPAFTYLIYGFFRLFVPESVLENSAKALRSSHEGEFAFMVYMIMAVSFFLYVLFKVKKGRTREKFTFAFLMLCSAPFLYMIDRGNNIVICLTFMMIFSFYYDSDIPWKKNLALVSLGMAASLKIYPALFGIILLKEKRWKDAAKCIGLAILVFVIPFFFFGGLHQIIVMVENIISTSQIFAANVFSYKVNIGNTAAFLVKLMGYGSRGQNIASQVMAMGVLVVSVVIFFICSKKWQQMTILSCLIVLVPSFSYTYNLLYMLIPLIFFLDKKEKEKLDVIYAILFALLFIPIIFTGNDIFTYVNGMQENLLSTVTESFAILALLGLILLENIIEFVLKRQKIGEKNEKKN